MENEKSRGIISIRSDLLKEFKVFSTENSLTMKGVTEGLIEKFMQFYIPTSQSIEKTISNINKSGFKPNL